MKRALGVLTAFALVMGVATVALAPAAVATAGDPHRVTICHRTASTTHPYVRITVDSASIDKADGNDHGKGDHNAEHTGPVFPATGPDGKWGDIIPPFYADGSTPGYWDSLNWDTDGQAIFANGCRFEGEEETGSLTLTKTIPDGIIEGDETYTIHFEVYDESDVLVGECDFVFDALSGTSQDCVIGNLPFGTYTVKETESAGFDSVADFTVTIPDANGNGDVTVEVDNTFEPATAEACKVTDVNGTGYDPTGDTFSFDLVLVADPSDRYAGAYLPGDVIDSVTVTIGTSVGDCETFSAVLKDDVTYDIVEQTPPTGWTTTGGIDEFTPQFPDDAKQVYTATFTNSIDAATAEACKTTVLVNAFGYTAADTYFKFTLYENGVAKESQFIGGSTPSHPTHCKSFDYVLKDGKTYTITEESKVYQKDSGPPVVYYEVTQPGWSFGAVTCTVDGVGPVTSFAVSYPGDAGKLFSCSATNTRTFPAPLTPGYWKNHLTLDRSHPLAPYTGKYLSLYLGNYLVDTNAKATAVFNAMNCSSSTAQGAVGCLAGHLLATKLNLANGSDGTCISAYVTQTDNFLKAIPKSPSGTLVYTGPAGTYSSMTAAARNTAIALKTKLDTFNNALGCS